MLSPPVVPEATVGPYLLESLQILSQLVIQLVGQQLGVLPVTDILLSVQKPVGDLVLPRVLHYNYDPLNLQMGGEEKSVNLIGDSSYLFFRQLPSSLTHINISFLADEVRIPSTDSLSYRNTQ